MLSPEGSAEPGKWKTDRAEYQRGIMDAVTDPSISDVVIMSSAQVGKSEILLNIIGYIMSQDPAPILMLQPTLEMAEGFSKDRIVPMLRDTPCLRGLIKDARSRDSGNTLLHKQFPGGHVTLAGANSPASLASRPIRVVLADEVDRYPISAGTEGDPLSLAERRTATFWNSKRVKVSTPTVRNVSRIEKAYLQSDRRQFFVPCPHCEEGQVLKWANVKWPEGKPSEAAYACAHCGVIWSEQERMQAIRRGEWRKSAPNSPIAGFHISELYSGWRSLGAIAADFLAAKDSPEQLKAWVNTSLGESWEEASDDFRPGALQARAEAYALGTIPEGGLLLTAGVDVQGDRLELYQWAWGEKEEVWVVDRQQLYGDPAHPVVWEQLLAAISRPLDHALGSKVVARMVAIDSGGHHTQQVYAFCRANATRRLPQGLQQVIAIKGQSQAAKAVVGKPTDQDVDVRGQKVRHGVKLWPVGSSTAKAVIYSRLSIEQPGPGFVHFSNQLPDDFYDQLTAEQRITKYVKGFASVEWHLPKGRRNEALDAAVYAYAAACVLGMARFRSLDWSSRRAQLTSRPEEKANKPAPKRDEDEGNWVQRW